MEDKAEKSVVKYSKLFEDNSSLIIFQETIDKQKTKELTSAGIVNKDSLKALIGLSLAFLIIITGLVVGLIVMNMKVQKLEQENQSLRKDLKSQEQMAKGFKAQNQNILDELKTSHENLEHCSKKSENSMALIRELNSYNHNLTKDIPFKTLQALILAAADNADVDQVKSFLQLGVNVNGQGTHDKSLLHYAAEKGNFEFVKILLLNGANINVKDWFNHKKYPLHYAAENGHFKVAEMLLANGAEVDAKSQFQTTPLHHAAKYGHSEMAELLLENAADINAQSKFENTPLHLAAQQGYPEVVEVLLKHGAKTDLKNTHLYIPLDEAEHYHKGDYKRVIALLKGE